MEETKELTPTEQTPSPADSERDQELFAAIGRGKRRKKRRRIIILAVILAALAAGLYAAVRYGRSRVNEQFGAAPTVSVQSYTVGSGSVTTTVSGTGQLVSADAEKLKIPEGVKLDEVLVEVGERVTQGQPLATVDMASVLSALSKAQTTINSLDRELRTTSNDAVSTFLTTNVPGRVKIVYAQEGDQVAAVMVRYGALAVMSIDGYMAVDIDAGSLVEGQEVQVVREDGKIIKGTVEKVVAGRATVLVTDNGPRYDEVVTVLGADGETLGSGALYIHNPLRITGYAGTIYRVNARENGHFYAGNSLFLLKDTGYSANYEAILRDRRTQEELLGELLGVYQAGAITAPFDGTVVSIEYKESTATPAASSSGDADTSGQDSEGETSSTPTPANTGELLTLSRDGEMEVTIHVDETDVLSLEVGQSAQVTVNSIPEEVFAGEVTSVSRVATGSAGVTSYTAVISLPRDERMLPGMSVKAVVRIQGVAGAILIPEEALHQSRDAAYVYTSADFDTGELGSPVNVVAGLSDGSMVEIVDGLSEGDTVYYTISLDPWAAYYASDGDAAGDAAWVETDAEAATAEVEALMESTASEETATVSGGDATGDGE